MSEKIVATLKYEGLDGGCRHSVLYQLPSGEQGVVWWEVHGSDDLLPRECSNDDIALVSLLFLAMRRGVGLHVEGKVSRSLLERAEEFIHIWRLWRPDLYQLIEVSADEEVDDRAIDKTRCERAIAAFSGGVDAAATAWIHTQNLGGRTGRKLGAGVLIQGFDIPLGNTRAFEKTAAACRLMLDDISVPMLTLKTNWRNEICGDWEMEFGLSVFSCLKLWEDEFGSLLVGSCEDYSRLVTPWGSHPLATKLLSSADVRLVYDGGNLNRTQKVKLLSDWSVGYDLLRVCWQGDVTGENCGQCEKCIRTKLNAIVSGVRLPSSLGSAPSAKQVARIGPMNNAQKALFEEILEEATVSDFKDRKLLAAMRIAMARRRPPIQSRVRHWLSVKKRKISAALG